MSSLSPVDLFSTYCACAKGSEAETIVRRYSPMLWGAKHAVVSGTQPPAQREEGRKTFHVRYPAMIRRVKRARNVIVLMPKYRTVQRKRICDRHAHENLVAMLPCKLRLNSVHTQYYTRIEHLLYVEQELCTGNKKYINR